MIGTVFLFVILLGFTFWFSQWLIHQYPGTKKKVFLAMIGMHIFLSIVYFIYGSLTASDSFAYYDFVLNNFRGPSWMDYYGVSSRFIEFVAYPFINFFGFSYGAMMILFSWFGLLGFFFFYVTFTERIRYRHAFMGYDLLVLILLLPNLHFWSSSLGKGSIIFLGFGLFFYSLSKPAHRLVTLVIGSVIIYHVRPHIMFVVLIGSIIGFAFSTRGTSWAIRAFIILLAVITSIYVYNDVLAITGIDEDAVYQQSMNLSARSRDLLKANSGVDVSQYGFPMKLFTFWFRPLFVDATGLLGIIVSFENLFYIFMFFKILKWDFISFFRQSDHIVKTAFISFLGVSAALAQISANLGLAMRQKSQVMILMLFVILKYLDDKRHVAILRKKKSIMIRAKRVEAKERLMTKS